MSLVRSFLCIGLASRAILSPVFFALRLLRVLELWDIEFHQFPTEILELVNLRYLAFSCNSVLPSAVSRLWNLQTLIVRSIIFPPSIIKLKLSWCRITWGFMKTVGSLPNLEVLKIQNCTFKDQEMQPTDQEWEPTEVEFCSVQFLLLEKLELVHWRADETHFPRLRHLVIRECSALEEIPSGIGDIPTLEIIELDK
ncbi:hypothetical protein Sango_0560000 [Sesamum angolense]|uniref:Disease resistance protein n=1 Tax=Sesamum angolense TaxID=2727404 RepID=A0AAE1X5A0_9LAMI|nr:hypothetical protein Sango_0560000 [Sesamum angolense]